jgi:hypothetical protein
MTAGTVGHSIYAPGDYGKKFRHSNILVFCLELIFVHLTISLQFTNMIALPKWVSQ